VRWLIECGFYIYHWSKLCVRPQSKWRGLQNTTGQSSTDSDPARAYQKLAKPAARHAIAARVITALSRRRRGFTREQASATSSLASPAIPNRHHRTLSLPRAGQSLTRLPAQQLDGMRDPHRHTSLRPRRKVTARDRAV